MTDQPFAFLNEGTIKLPEIPPDGIHTLLGFFTWRFPRVGEAVWERRFAEGKVRAGCRQLAAGEPYQPLLEIRYAREVPEEWPVRSDFRIVFQSQDLLVVDKPPFLPVTPAGHYLNHCLLNRLIIQTGNRELTPLHRIDKDTSGLVLFSVRRATRSHYAGLFRPGASHLEKEYLALCENRCNRMFDAVRLADHIERSSTQYHRQTVNPDKAPNSFLTVFPLKRGKDRALCRILPETGKKHQIRVQMSHFDLPIVGDRLYGLHPRQDPWDLESEMCLCCNRLSVRGFRAPEGREALTLEWRSRFGERYWDWLDE